MSSPRTAEAEAGVPSDASEARCPCGSLLARLCEDGVELKCRRCKRVVLLPWPADRSWREIEPACVTAQGSSPGVRATFGGGIPPAGMGAVAPGGSAAPVRRRGAL